MSEKTCRICLKKCENLVSLQSSCEAFKEVSYATMYKFVCDISPLNDPQFLCLSCTPSLITAFEFRKRLEENEKTLRLIDLKRSPLQTELILFESNTNENLDCEPINAGKQVKRNQKQAKLVEKKFGCPDCEESFPYSYHLKKHRRTVHNYQPENVTTICGYCGKLCSQKSLDSHIKNIHFKSDTEFTCDLCQAKVSTKPGLINHMRSKHMELIYSCRYCEESFPNYSCRRTHEVRFHTFDYKFTCNFCPKKFMERVQLRKHIATHTGERRYRCEICAMAFITLTNLKLHLASHSDERPHCCQICNASFKTRMALKKHDRIHNERDYECPVCCLKYLVNQQLRLHIKRNHPEYPLPPPGTVMNKSALKRINAVAEKYKVQVSPSVGLSSRKNSI
ncbi:zinc finger protein 615-like [Culicoides brevitarsis]|uniref:zinc finger protein 615-like n=1 Tax=Culicoides brevitarsis TaxID=469753 RepID=UPI00307B4859